LNAHKKDFAFQAILIDSVVDNVPGIEIVHLLVGQGIPVANLVLAVETAEASAAYAESLGFRPSVLYPQERAGCRPA
jgi:hypothetical protein